MFSFSPLPNFELRPWKQIVALQSYIADRSEALFHDPMTFQPEPDPGILRDDSDTETELSGVPSEQQKASDRRRFQEAKFGSWYGFKMRSNGDTDIDLP